VDCRHWPIYGYPVAIRFLGKMESSLQKKIDP